MADQAADNKFADEASQGGEYKPYVVHLEQGQRDPNHQVEFTGRQFGTVQGYDEQKQHILIPQPSDHPDDPLNFSYGFKQYLAALSCAAVLCCNITGAGPSIAIVQQTIQWFGAPPTDANISKTAYLFTSTALANGVGLFFWVPAITKWGRRPTYITAFTLYLACLFWVAFAKSFGAELAGRIILGLASGAGECLGALTVTDIFFAHERGLYMAYYNVFLSCGAAVGLIIDGAVTQHLSSWRYFYYVDIAIVGAVLLLVIFTFPETLFNRNSLILNGHGGNRTEHNKPMINNALPRKTNAQRLSFFSGVFTEESYWRMVARPFGIVLLPAVFFSTLTFSATIGFLVAVTSNVAPAYEQILGYSTQATAFQFFGAIIGSLLGIPAGGWLGDKLSDLGAKRNNGVREPEHRLPAMIIPIITGPLSLILYGLCIQNKTHWIVGCLGISLVNFNVCAATNITMVYSIDCYKPIADEVVTATLAFKAIIGFVLGFYTNTWVTKQGYLNGYAEMAGIEAGLLLLAVPMYFYGKRLRNWSSSWGFLQWAVRWNDDRDDLMVE